MLTAISPSYLVNWVIELPQCREGRDRKTLKKGPNRIEVKAQLRCVLKIWGNNFPLSARRAMPVLRAAAVVRRTAPQMSGSGPDPGLHIPHCLRDNIA